MQEIIQRSNEWYAIRKRKMTASKANTVITNGTGLETYIKELMSEYYSSAEPDNYISKDMQRGIDLEPEAKIAYEVETGQAITDIGFVIYNEYFGASPDGLVNDDGLAEIKCINDKKYLEFLLNPKIPKPHYDQMQGQMLATNRKWCDYVVYNPNFEKSLVIIRVERDEPRIELLKLGIETGSKIIEEITEKIEGKQNKVQLLEF